MEGSESLRCITNDQSCIFSLIKTTIAWCLFRQVFHSSSPQVERVWKSDFLHAIKPHSFLLFWLLCRRQDTQPLATSWPLLFNCHPSVSSQSKLSDCHHQSASSLRRVRKKKCEKEKPGQVQKKKTFPSLHQLLYFISGSGRLRWERKHVGACCVDWLLSVSPRHCRHKSPHVQSWKASQMRPLIGATFPWVSCRRAHIQHIFSWHDILKYLH